MELRILLFLVVGYNLLTRFHSFNCVRYNNQYYKGGMMFQAVHDAKRKDILAGGGRYDSLIQQFRHPVIGGPHRKVYAVGVNIAMQKIIMAISQYQSEHFRMFVANKSRGPNNGNGQSNNDEEKSFGLWAPKRCDVYVASFGKVLLQERLELVRELWAHGIKADYMLEDGTDLTPEMLVTTCKHQGINWIVILKNKNQQDQHQRSNRDMGMVKVKNVLRKTEDEILRSELCILLKAEIAEQNRLDLQMAMTAGAGHIGGAKARKFVDSSSGHHHHHHQEAAAGSAGTRHDHHGGSGESAQVHTDFNVNVISSGRNRLKHKQKTMLIDKGKERDNIWLCIMFPLSNVEKANPFFFIFLNDISDQ